MRELSRSERSVAVAYYLLNLLATVVWHAAMLSKPGLHRLFVGQLGGYDLYGMFLFPDLVYAFGLAGATAWLLRRESPFAPGFAWFFAGGQGYAFLTASWLTLRDPASYWGMLLMAFSAGTSVMFAVRLSRIDLLWGPFAFRPAPAAPSRAYWFRSLDQTARMWIVFLLLIPAAIAAFEIVFKLTGNWFHSLATEVAGVLLFVCGASFGLWAGHLMCSTGEGTPLPSHCAKALVVGGPYRIVRNPMAVGGIAQGIGVGLMIGSPLIVLYAILGGVAWNTLVRPLEEEYLEGVFGDEYLAYVARVRCWIPKR